ATAEERLPPLGAEDRAAHYTADKEITGAGTDLPGCSFPSDRTREAVRLLCAEYAAGRRNEFAAVPEHPRTAGVGIFDLQRLKSLSRYRMPFCIRGDVAAIGGKSCAVDRIGIQAAQIGEIARGGSAAGQGSIEGQPDALPGVFHVAYVESGPAGYVF